MTRNLPLLLLASLLVIAPATAATPLGYTRTILEQARTIAAGNQTQNEKLASLYSLFDQFLDTDTMGREALGQHWSSFSPVQQKEFLVLFHRLLQETYVHQLLLFQNPKFVYAGQQITAHGAIVDTKIVTRDQFDVTYQLRQAGDKWLATGIAVEEISLVQNLGNQFNRLLARITIDDLLALMQRKFGKSSEDT